MQLTHFPFFLCAVIASGCSVPTQKYVAVDPYARAFEQPSTMDLVIVFEDVPDAMTVAGAGIKPMTATEFHRTFRDGLTSVFRKNFRNVSFAEQRGASDLELVMHRVRGEYDKAAVIEGPSYRNYEVRGAFRWDATLYMHGRKVIGGEQRTIGEQSASSISQARLIYADAVKALCEAIARSMFPDEVQALVSGGLARIRRSSM